MKTFLLTLAALLVLGSTLQAQSLKFGIKGGVSISRFDFNPTFINGVGIHSNISSKSWDYHMGAMLRLQIPGFIFIQPELLYTLRTTPFSLYSEGGTTRLKLKTRSFDLPVMIGFNLGFLRLNAGPVFKLSSKTKTPNNAELFSVNFGKAQVGFQAGVGFNLKRVTLEARYGTFLGNSKADFQINGETHTVKTKKDDQLMLSLGVFF